jgi:hypothetical protein
MRGDICLFFRRAEPKKRGFLPGLYFFEFPIGSNKNTVEVDGSGETRGIREGNTKSTFELDGFFIMVED